MLSSPADILSLQVEHLSKNFFFFPLDLKWFILGKKLRQTAARKNMRIGIHLLYSMGMACFPSLLLFG